jgi:hypothetical protein
MASHGEGGSSPGWRFQQMEAQAAVPAWVLVDLAASLHLRTCGKEARPLVHLEPSWPPRQELPARGRGCGAAS